MKVFHYVLRNVLRNKLRSLLTVLAIWICLMLMTFLYGYLAVMRVWQGEAAKYNRLVVMNLNGFTTPLPYSTVDRVRNMPGVAAATAYSWFGGKYIDERHFFAQFGTEPEWVFEVWNEFKIAPEELDAFRSDRNGCVCDQALAEQYGWKLGERIRLEGTIYPVTLDLTLVGIYEAPNDVKSLWFNWHNLDESLKKQGSRMNGNAGVVFLRAEDQETIPKLKAQIDNHFASSDHPTHTQPEHEFAQMFVKMQGNIQNFILFIGVFVTIALTFVAANGMALSMRERTMEIAVLKAIGFRNGLLLRMVLGEAVIIALVGGLLGVSSGRGIYALAHQAVPQMFPLRSLPWAVMGYGLVVAAGIGLASGLIPAVLAARLSVVNGLRRVV